MFMLNTLGFGVQSQVNIPFTGSNTVACGTNTILRDHGGTGNYSNNANGFTVLQNAGSAIITISGTSAGEACCDRVSVFRGVGTGGVLVGTYWMGTAIPTITSTAGQALTVQFISDGSVDGAGVTINVTYSGSCVPLPSLNVPFTGNNSNPCGTNITLYDHAGTGVYGNNANGFTVLDNAGSAVITLSGTSSGESCCDYVRVFRGVGTGGTLVGTYYMNTAIPTITSLAGQALTVQFISDGSVTGNGFQINVSYAGSCAVTSCSGTPNSGTASISSASGCSGSAITLSSSGFSSGTGISYQWQSAPAAGGPWTNIAGAISSTASVNPSATTFYRMVTSCSNGGATNTTNVVSYTVTGTSCAGVCPINISSLPVSNQSVACTGTNLLNSGNVPACGAASTLYLDGNEALYTVVPTVSGNSTISYSGQTWSSIWVWSGTCPNSGGTCVGSVSGSGSSQTLTISMTAGVTYYILFDTYPSPPSPCPGTFSITTPSAPPAAPANDLVCSATAITCGSTLSGSTVNATNSGTGENGACGTAQTMPGVWYVVAGNGQTMTASLCATAWDSKISVFSGPNCSTLTCIGGNDDSGPACASSSASYSWPSVVGQNYYILVHGYSANSAFSINLSCVAACPAPSNDLCANAPILNLGAINNQTHLGTGCGSTANLATYKDVWVAFTVPCGGMNVTIDFCGSSPVHNNAYINIFPDCSFTTFTGATTWDFTSCAGGNIKLYWNNVPQGTYYYPILIDPTWETNYVLNISGTPLYTPAVAPTSITGTTAVCSGQSTTLTLQGGSAGTNGVAEWFAGSCGSAVIGTGNSIPVSPAVNTTYFVRYAGSCNTTACVSTSVTINASTAPTLSGTSPVCPATSVVINATGGTASPGSTINWYTGPNGTGSFLGTGSSYTVTPSATSTYYARREGGCNTTSDGTYTITVNGPTGIAPTNGDMVWRGAATTDWATLGNWWQYNGTSYGAATAAPTALQNVIIPANQTCVLNQPNTLANAGNAKTLRIENGANLTMGNGTLTVAENWVNNGTFTPGSGTVAFTGTGNHSISGSSTTHAFNNLTMNKNGEIILSVPIIIAGSLTLTDGRLNIVNFNLDLPTNTINGGNASSYVKTSGTGTLNRNVAGIPVSFPVGRSAYNAATLTNFGTADKYSIRVIDNVTDIGTNADAGPTTSMAVVNRTWMINEQVAGGSNVTLGLNWNDAPEHLNGFQPTNAFIAHYMSSAGLWDNIGGAVATNTIETPGITSFSPFTISSDLNFAPLPVELMSFTTVCLDNDVAIKWTTASENNSMHFIVETSTDALNWDILSVVPAAQFSTSILNYAITHVGAAREKNYYRLKQVDLDGAVEFFNVIYANCGNVAGNPVVFPNPSNGDFTIDFSGAEMKGVVQLSIMNTEGKEISNREVNLEEGVNTYQFNNMEPQPGIYYLKIVDTTGRSFIIKHSFI